MQGNKTILDELRAISPVVAGIGSAPTYRVPDGYFEAFAGTVAGIKDPAILAGLRDQPSYGVPVGFFDGFAETLMRRIKADEASSAGEELEILSPLLSRLEKKELFTEPVGYFSELPGNLVAELQALRFVNDELEKTGLEKNEFEKTELDKNDPLEVLSPLMNGLKNKQAYTVPEGYFDTLVPTLLARVNREGAKVVSMNRGRIRVWMKYAVAAALTGLLVTAGIRVYHHDEKPPVASGESNMTNNLAKISDQEILNYLENQNEQNEPLSEAGTNSTATLDINDSDVKDFLGGVPDAELQQYSDEHGSSKNSLTN